MSFAPIALFVYDRPAHLQQTVEALRANELAPESSLFIFSDAARRPSATAGVAEVRTYIRTITGFKSIAIVERAQNLGLASSIIDGVTSLVNAHGRVIVLEDDMITSRYFLRFMNEALEFYEHEDRVISVHGYVYPVGTALPETFFLLGADCWGWATWQRGWNLFEPDGRALYDELARRGLAHRFDFDGAYPYMRMLKEQIRGRNNSWAVRWHASAFLKGKLTLYPGRSLVLNIGIDGSGTHCSTSNGFAGVLSNEPIKVARIPIEANAFARQQIIEFHKASRLSTPTRILRRLATMVRRVR